MGLSRWESSKKSFPNQAIPPHLTPSHLNLISYKKIIINTLYIIDTIWRHWIAMWVPVGKKVDKDLLGDNKII